MQPPFRGSAVAGRVSAVGDRVHPDYVAVYLARRGCRARECGRDGVDPDWVSRRVATYTGGEAGERGGYAK